MNGAGGPAGPDDSERLARAAISYLVEPADEVFGELLTAYSPGELLAAIKADRPPAGLAGRLAEVRGRPVTGPVAGAITRAMSRWRARLPELPPDGTLDRLARGDLRVTDGGGRLVSCEFRLVCPGDAEWPEALGELGTAQPYVLWVRGAGELRDSPARSVSVVGSRACTGYGAHVAGVLAGELAERGWTVVSGGAYGIDAAAHRAALHAGGQTVAVLACGVDFAYPAGHAGLFAAIEAGGLIVSEWPPGSRPTRLRFLVRNRVIAALGSGTVVVEAGRRSGALNTARHAAELGRKLMAVPGPVTSEQSDGCHRIIREWNGACVTCTADVLEMLSPVGVGREPSARPPDPRRPRDQLDLSTAQVLDAFPPRAVVGPAALAVQAGLDLNEVLGSLGTLLAAGLIETADGGLRLTRLARE
ncbi:MAG TPA: DNA-processing protein DprA [Streptosporangiaceae bacterium]|nr:DNA-processing protein DprA [Streptosporangiaceae bacterium]